MTVATAEWMEDIDAKMQAWKGKHKGVAKDIWEGVKARILANPQGTSVEQVIKSMRGKWPGTAHLIDTFNKQPKLVAPQKVLDQPTGVPLTSIGGLPGQTAGTPKWYIGKGPEKPIPGSTPKDMIQQLVTNMALPYMAGDPTTQAETAQWLARSHPEAYGAYENVPITGQLVQPGQQISREAIADFTKRLDYDRLKEYLTKAQQKQFGDTKNAAERADIKAGTRWLKEYLRTGAQALGPGVTRKQQQFAKQHMATLMREAQKEPGVSGLYTTLGENLLNPVLARAPVSGIFGTRALKKPSGDYMRGGVAYRNPTAL